MSDSHCSTNADIAASPDRVGYPSLLHSNIPSRLFQSRTDPSPRPAAAISLYTASSTSKFRFNSANMRVSIAGQKPDAPLSSQASIYCIRSEHACRLGFVIRDESIQSPLSLDMDSALDISFALSAAKMTASASFLEVDTAISPSTSWVQIC